MPDPQLHWSYESSLEYICSRNSKHDNEWIIREQPKDGKYLEIWFWDNRESIWSVIWRISCLWGDLKTFWRFCWTSKIIWILPSEQIRITTHLPADPINKFYIDDNQQTNPTSDNGTIVPRYWRLLHTITTLKVSHGKNLDFPTSSLTPQSIFIPHRKQLIHGLREYVSLTLKQLLEKYLFAARSGIIHVYLPFQ